MSPMTSGHDSKALRAAPPALCPRRAGRRVGARLIAELADEELAAGGGEGHDELVVALVAFVRVFGHRLNEGVASGLGDAWDHQAGWRQGSVDVGSNDFVDTGGLKRDMPSERVIERSGQ